MAFIGSKKAKNQHFKFIAIKIKMMLNFNKIGWMDFNVSLLT